MTVPLLAIPYIYLTYFEILFTPVRNVIFFVYLFAGALIYATVVALTGVDRTRDRRRSSPARSPARSRCSWRSA